MDLITDTGIGTTGIDFSFGFVFKFAFTILFFLYVIYSYLLASRVKILADTVRTPWNKSLERVAFFHLYAVIVVGLFAVFLIVIA